MGIVFNRKWNKYKCETGMDRYLSEKTLSFFFKYIVRITAKARKSLPIEPLVIDPTLKNYFLI